MNNDASEFLASQKIIYELKANRERTIAIPPDGCKEGRQLNDLEYETIGEIPFLRLLGGKEPLSNVSIRYDLYKKNWNRQIAAINAVLLKTDRFKFRSLRDFLSMEHRNEFESRLTTALLNLGSNISNHDRLLNNVCRYLREDSKVCLVRINPSMCFNIQRIMKRLEDTIACKLHDLTRNSGRSSPKKRGRDVSGTNKRRYISPNDNEEESSVKKEQDGAEDEETPDTGYESDNVAEKDDDDDDEYSIAFNLGVNNDFDLLPKNIQKGKYVDTEDMLRLFKKSGIRLMVLIQNADAMSSILLEQTLNLLYKYNSISETSCLIGISTPFIIFQEKISKLLIGRMKTRSFAIDNSNEAINQIMEDLLLNINETYNSLIFDPKLVLKFLYKRDVMSIQQFTNYMKMIYMRHYFSQPLSLFWTNDFSRIDLKSIYFEIFKTLPSVIENSNEIEKKYLIGIADDNVQIIGELLRKNLNKLINWRYDFRNLIDFLNFLQASILDQKIWQNNLELFQLLFEKYYELRDSEDSLFNEEEDIDNDKDELELLEKKKGPTSGNANISPVSLLLFLDPIWLKITELPAEKFSSFYKQICNDEQFNFISKHKKFPHRCPSINKIGNLTNVIRTALRDQICELDLDSQAFREICVIKEDTTIKIHDGFEPSVRENCLRHLDEPGKLLFNPRHWTLRGGDAAEEESRRDDVKMFHLIEPILCEMYRIFKETGVSSNVYDFYQVFKNSIVRKKEVVKLLRLKLADEESGLSGEHLRQLGLILEKVEHELDEDREAEWDKLTLSWFLKSISEFEILGLLREGGGKSQNVEKVVWRGI